MRWSLLRSIAAGATVLSLTSCGLPSIGSGYPAGVDPTVKARGEPAPTVNVEADTLPEPLAGRRLVDLGWEEIPNETDGVFVGLSQVTEDALQISAIRSDGTILWDTERPLACTGFALTSSGDRPVAVLTDLSPGILSVAETTASAYDLHTGEQVWGPVEVPGTHAGPGLVFAEVTSGGAMGTSGPRVVLDPATGEVAGSEEDLVDARLVGEYHGTVLIADDRHLVAHMTNDGRHRWRLPLADLGLGGVGPVVAAPGSTPGHGLALVGTREEGYALVDLAEGTVLATAVQDAATDPSGAVHVTLAHDELIAYDGDGEPLWDEQVEPGTRIASAGGGVLYLLVDDQVTARDIDTGASIEVFETTSPGVALPRHSDAVGATVLQTSRGLVFATAGPPAATSPLTKP